MSNVNPKIVVIITMRGVECVTIQAIDDESRNVGYETCKALEPVFANANQVVRGINDPGDGVNIQ